MPYIRDTFGHPKWYDDKPQVTAAEIAALAKAMPAAPVSGKQQDEHIRRLESKRQERLTRETWDSMTEQERTGFESTMGDLTIIRTLAAQAQQIADEQWIQSEQASLQKTLVAYRKSLGRVKVRDQEGHEWTQDSPDTESRVSQKGAELGTASQQRAAARLAAREQRELEAEVHDDETQRLVASLGKEERQILAQLVKQQPSRLQRLQSYLAQNRNPLAEIENPQELYQLAVEQTRQKNLRLKSR